MISNYITAAIRAVQVGVLTLVEHLIYLHINLFTQSQEEVNTALTPIKVNGCTEGWVDASMLEVTYVRELGAICRDFLCSKAGS